MSGCGPEGGAHFAPFGAKRPCRHLAVWSHGAQTQRIDELLSGGPGSAGRPIARCLVWRRGHRGRSVSRASRAGAGRPASLCVAAGPSRSRMASTLHAGALRRIPPRSCSRGFGPVGGLAMLAAGDQMNHSVALSQERSLEAVDLSRLGAGVVRSFLKMRRRMRRIYRYGQ